MLFFTFEIRHSQLVARRYSHVWTSSRSSSVTGSGVIGARPRDQGRAALARENGQTYFLYYPSPAWKTRDEKRPPSPVVDACRLLPFRVKLTVEIILKFTEKTGPTRLVLILQHIFQKGNDLPKFVLGQISPRPCIMRAF